MRRPPRLYFSFRSPYSWMAVERLRRAVPDLFERFELFPYWDPDATMQRALRERGAELPYQQMSKAKHLYVLGDTKRLAARLGLRMAWPVDIDPWWELPHLAWLAARRAGLAERCYDALVEARWGAGADICEAEVFGKVVGDAGLDAEALLAAAGRDDVRAEGLECLVAAYEDDVFGVPYLRLGRQRFWGLDRVGLFVEELRRAAAGAATHPGPEAQPGTEVDLFEVVDLDVPVGAYDRDTAGGCG